ncbi:MAG: hypothetical protein ACUVQG_06455 [Thermogutta sp.]
MAIKRRFWTLGSIFCLGIAIFAGCHSRPPLEELGELEFAVPNLPGIDDPYPFPENGPANSAQSNSEQPHESL